MSQLSIVIFVFRLLISVQNDFYQFRPLKTLAIFCRFSSQLSTLIFVFRSEISTQNDFANFDQLRPFGQRLQIIDSVFIQRIIGNLSAQFLFVIFFGKKSNFREKKSVKNVSNFLSLTKKFLTNPPKNI